MKKLILEKLKQIEIDRNVTVLYAVESGSRVWGYANEESDYDIRFIYKKNDLKDYLVLNKIRDVIEYNDGLYDLVGWDISKALYLHYKSNPNLREWIITSQVYIEDTIGLFDNLPEFNRQSLKYHYFALANNTYKKYLCEYKQIDFNIYKKMLHASRCILTWKLLQEDVMPPINIHEIMNVIEIPERLENSINKLYYAYSQLDNSMIDEVSVSYLLKWIRESVEYMKNDKSQVEEKRNIEEYNQRFQNILLK